MLIKTLTDYLKEDTLQAFTPIPDCPIKNGIQFMLPNAAAVKEPGIFLGYLNDWNAICENHLYNNGSTYLICIEDENLESSMNHVNQANAIFVKLSIKALLYRISSLVQQEYNSIPYSTEQLYQKFWEEVTTKKLCSHQEVLTKMQSFPYPVQSFISCILIRYNMKVSPNRDKTTITEQLKSFFPQTNLFQYQNEWIVLFSQSNRPEYELAISYEAFSAMLMKNSLIAGVSNACRQPEQLRTLYLTASGAIELGQKLPDKPYHPSIYTFLQYSPYYMIHLCAQKYMTLQGHDDLIYLVHPAVIELYRYDQNNRNDLLNILYTYLQNGHSVSLTAQKLFMHRNTVLNKLNKINEIIPLSLENSETQLRLLLSCLIIKYYKYCMGHDIERLS